MKADWKEAKKLQRPLPASQMIILPRYIEVGGLGRHPAKGTDLFAQ